MNRTTLLTRAAELLEEDARAGEESCSIGERLWTCADCDRDKRGHCSAQRATDDRRRIAAALRLLDPQS
jgi:hypothetical protein